MKEVNDLLNRLGELEDAPLIWINKKVYDMAQEIERLNNIINKAIEIYENRNSIEHKKNRFMEDKTIGYFMYKELKGVDKK